MPKTIDHIVSGARPFIIAGPCVAESESVVMTVAEELKSLAGEFGVDVVFKSSYSKANRLSGESYHGPGALAGLELLARVRSEFDLPVLTDVHETGEVEDAAEVVDVIQIPAFLCRQTDLVRAAGQSGKWVNIKKGQFLAPEDMTPIVKKASSKKVMVTERGTTFGYRNLVVDFRSLLIMRDSGAPVVFDATHSLQLPGAGGGKSSGQPEFIIPFAKAAVAIGVNGLFVETHPDPTSAKSDSGAMLPLRQMREFLQEVLTVHSALTKKSKETVNWTI